MLLAYGHGYKTLLNSEPKHRDADHCYLVPETQPKMAQCRRLSLCPDSEQVNDTIERRHVFKDYVMRKSEHEEVCVWGVDMQPQQS